MLKKWNKSICAIEQLEDKPSGWVGTELMEQASEPVLSESPIPIPNRMQKFTMNFNQE